jgi:hypothetical protein
MILKGDLASWTTAVIPHEVILHAYGVPGTYSASGK